MDRGDVIVVPFPFTDRRASKRRPALVLSAASTFNARAGHAVMAMITSATHAPWPLDVAISDLAAAGLPAPSVVRMKLFTLDERLILDRIGHLATKDARAVAAAMSRLVG
jgi:mRNA interferase MazF